MTTISLNQVYNITVDGMQYIDDRDLTPYYPADMIEISRIAGFRDLEDVVLMYLYQRRNVPGSEIVKAIQTIQPSKALQILNTLKQLEAKSWIVAGGFDTKMF